VTNPAYSGGMAAKILLVASDPAEALFLSETLVQGGYRVIPSDDTIAALPLARREAPDLVLVDLTLAGGMMLLSRLSLFPDTAMIPTLALADSQLLAGEAMRMGTRAVLNKPIITPDLLAAVSDHVMSPGALTAAPPTLLAHPPRLDALRDLGVLDTPPEETYDRFTRLVAHILDVPVALISLVDDERQFFMSQVGLREPWSTMRQTPLSHSFCQFTVTFRQPVVINDAREHPLVTHNLAVSEMGVAAYAGVPLITSSGEAVGSLCAMDAKPREWSDDDVAVLADLGAILIELLELRSRGRAKGSEAGRPEVS